MKNINGTAERRNSRTICFVFLRVSFLHNARKAWLPRLSKGCQLGDYDVINTNVSLSRYLYRIFISCSVSYSAIIFSLIIVPYDN